MTIKCYIIENSAACAAAVAALEHSIPCFPFLELLDDSYIEYTIHCRLEDVAAVEAALAAFV